MHTRTWLLALIGILIAVATAAGIFYRTPGPQVPYVTARGENAMLQGNGLYRYDPASVAREGIVWDVVNLFIVLPMFIAVAYLHAGTRCAGNFS